MLRNRRQSAANNVESGTSSRNKELLLQKEVELRGSDNEALHHRKEPLSLFAVDEDAPRRLLEQLKAPRSTPPTKHAAAPPSSSADGPPVGLVYEPEPDDCLSLESGSVSGENPHPASSTVAAAEGHASLRHKSRRWRTRFQPRPVVSQNTIFAWGVVLFVLACLWPPLVLLVAYILSRFIPYAYRTNDDAATRRKIFRDFVRNGEHPERFQRLFHGDDDKRDHNTATAIHREESYWVNDRGMALCTVIMTPPPKQPIRAVVCFCHGYTDNVSYSKQIEYQRLVEHGIAFVGIEYEGHGRSDGMLGLISDWDQLVHDAATYFQETLQTQKRFQNVPAFLMGESMGGAVAYSVYQRTASSTASSDAATKLFQGVVFVCPMCKISDDMLPPQWVVKALTWLVGPPGSQPSWLGSLPLAPSRNDLCDVAHRLPEKAELLWRCPTTYDRSPRLVTAREMLRATQYVSHTLSDFAAPFLVVHGREDRVTDPKLSFALYNESRSVDKSLRLYDGMWHSLTSGEPDDNIDRVFRDCIDWILERCRPNDDDATAGIHAKAVAQDAVVL